MRSATVPFGWIIGCPLLGFISDRIGRRKPVIVVAAFVLLVCLAWILYGRPDRAAALRARPRDRARLGCRDAAVHGDQGGEPRPRERHRHRRRELHQLHLQRALGPRLRPRPLPGGAGTDGVDLAAYQTTFEPLLYGVGLAIVLTLLLKETGPAARRLAMTPAEVRP